MTETTTSLPEFFSIEDGVVCFRPVGENTPLDRAVGLVDDAIRYCHQNQIRGLLVNLHELTGIPAPSTADRYFFISRWAETAGGKVALAMVVPDYLLDEDRIGVTMAGNRGLVAHATEDEAEAFDWIKGVTPAAAKGPKRSESIL